MRIDQRPETRDERPETKDSRLKTQDSNFKSRVSCLRSQVSGFTLVEIMLVVIIIGVLAAMVVPRFAGRTEQAKIARAKSDLAAVSLALDLYELDTGRYPASLAELTAKEAPSALSGEAKAQWRGPYLKKGVPRDPWGRDYHYAHESQHSQDYDLASLGPDGQPGNDDITNWQ